MRIAVDATSLLDVRTGVGNFAQAVLERLGAREDVEVTAFPVSLRGHGRLRALVPPGVAVASPPLPARLLRRAWVAGNRPRIDRFIGGHDLVYGPNFVVPPSRAVRVATVHDLTAVRFPELCTPDTLQYPALIRRALDDGAHIHTVSEAVRREVLDHFGADPDRVVAIPNGFRDASGGDPGAGRRIAGRDAYVLAVGTVEPRKDLPTLVRAIDRLASEGNAIPLVHVGHDGWGTAEFEAAIGAMRRPDLVTRLGPRTDDELDHLYAGARVFAYPSLYEGFGLPVLEAMSAGTSVVASDDPAIAEVAGEAARSVPVGDAPSLARTLDDVWNDDDQRRELARAGRRRVEEYSWDRCVDGLVAMFRAVVVDGGGS